MSKLIVIVGPTASGKTDLALKIAQTVGGEIICADSRTIYRGMDIGTAKPAAEEQMRIRHHLLDILDPPEPYSAAAFKRDASAVLTQVAGQDKPVIMAGGSGLYAYSLIYDYAFPAGPPSSRREELNKMELPDLVNTLKQLDPERAQQVDTKNRRRVVRAIESAGSPRAERQPLDKNTLLLGLFPGMESLDNKIVQRTEAMFRRGLVDEVKGLVQQYGRTVEAFNTVGYAEVIEHIYGDIALDEAMTQVAAHTRQLARRQMTWFKRNSDIRWFEDPERARYEAEAFAL